MSVKKSGEGSGFEIGGFKDASLDTSFEARKTEPKTPKMQAGELQNRGQHLRGLTSAQKGSLATGAMKTYEFPNSEDEFFKDNTEGEYDPVMAALRDGALPGFDPVGEAVKISTVSIADQYDEPLHTLPDDVFSSSGFMALGDMANQRTRNS